VLVPPDDPSALVAALPEALAIDRRGCRSRAEERFGLGAFAERVERWLLAQPG
jgi:glycosyltransferase involved in cell wall biosynthesis